MQKKILLSLLMASPTTLPALADINFGPGTWVPTGLGEEGKDWTYDELKGTFTNTLGTGKMVQTIDLAPGKYTISFKTTTNLQVDVLQNGAKIPTKGNLAGTGGSLEFEITETGSVSIEAYGKTPNQYGFTIADLKLDFDFVAAGEALQTELDGLPTFAEITDETFPGAADLLKEKVAIENKIKASQKVINRIKNAEDPSVSADALKKLYADYQLYADPSLASKNIADIENSIVEWNMKAEALNTQIANTATNTENKTALVEAQNGLLTAVNQLISNIAAGSEYAQGLGNTAAAADLKAKIEAFGQAVEDAYAADKLAGSVIDDTKLKETYTDLKNQLVTLDNKWSNDQADWDAYNTYMNTVFPDLQNAFDSAKTAVNAISGVKGQENIFDEKKDALIDDLEKVFTGAKDRLQIKQVAGARDLIANDTKTVKDAKEEMSRLVNGFKFLIDTQNENYTAAAQQENAFNRILKECMLETVPEQLKEAYADAFNAAKTAIDNFGDYIFNNYEATKLDIEIPEYTDQVSNINDLLKKLQNLVGPAVKINQLNQEWEDLDDYIKKQSTDLGESIVNLYALFSNKDGVLESIKSGINKLVPPADPLDMPAFDKQVQSVKDAIDSAKGNADQLYDVFVELISADAEYGESVDALTKFVNEKIELNANGEVVAYDKSSVKKTFMASGKGGIFVKGRNEFRKGLESLKLSEDNPTPQAIYDKALAMSKTLMVGEKPDVTYYWLQGENGLDAIVLDFAKQVTDSNKKYLDAYITKMKELVKGSSVDVQEAIVFGEIDTKALDIRDAIAATSNPTIDVYATADNDIKALFDQLVKIEPNVKAYNDLMGQIIGKEGLQSKIDALNAKNVAESKDGGLEYFKDLIDTTIQTPVNTLKDSLVQALKDYNNDTEEAQKSVVAQKDNFQNQIDALSKLIDKTAQDITDNNNYHNGQLNKAEEVYNAITDALTKLEDLYQNQTGINEWHDETKAKLESLRDNDLFNNNVAVANAYGKGESKVQDPTLIAEYERILSEISIIDKAMTDEYAQAVKVANDKIVADARWDASIADMNSEYLKAIEAYNAYYYGLNNQGWREAVIPVVKRHQVIYDYSQMINDLIADVEAYINGANDTPKTIAADDFKKAATDKAQDFIERMQKEVNDMNVEAAAEAVNYYNSKSGTAQTQIDGYKKQLEDAGIKSDCLKDVETALKTAESQYKVATDPEKATEELGLAMDHIAEWLDKANQTVDLQPVAESAWSTEYGKAVDTVKGLLNDIDNKNEYKFADPDVKEAAKEAINAALEEMGNLNEEVGGVKEDLIDQYKGFKDRLDEILESAQDEAQKVLKSSQDNAKSQEIYDSVIAAITDYLNQLQELKEYADSMVGGQSYNGYDAILNNIKGLETFVKKNSATLFEKEADVERLQNAIEFGLENGYQDIAYDEQTWLNKVLLAKTQVAFNDAKAAFMGAEGTVSNLDKKTGEETINGWNNAIDKQAAAITALALDITPDAFKKDEFKTKALGIETALSDIYQACETSWTGKKHEAVNPADAAIKNLQNLYAEVEESIKGGNDYLAGCEYLSDDKKAEYGKLFQDATDSLEAQPAVWTAAGNRIIDMEPTYAEALNGIKDSVENALENLKADNEAAILDHEKTVASQAAFERLTADLNALKERFEKIRGLAGEWYPEQYDPYIERIDGQFVDAENWLKEQNEKKDLNAESTLTPDPESNINYLETVVSRRKASDAEHAAFGAMDEARNYLSANKRNIVPEEWIALSNTLAGYNDRYTEIYSKYIQNVDGQQIFADYETLVNEVIPEFYQLASDCETLKADIQSQIFVRGDVNLNPDGLVTAADVQIMIGWILDGVTWQDLLQQNPRQAYAADLNDDQDLNVTDVAMDISLVFGEEPTQRRLGRFAAPAVDSSASMQVELVGEENGVRRYAVMLNSSVEMIAGQMDIKLPSGVTLKGVSLGERAEDHKLEYAEHGFDSVRVVLYSMENAAFAGNDGAVIYIDVEGRGDVKTENAIFTDTYFGTHEMGSNETTFIDSIIDGAKGMKDRFYNTAGMMFNKLQNGINIFRGTDGKVKKQYHRNK